MFPTMCASVVTGMVPASCATILKATDLESQEAHRIDTTIRPIKHCKAMCWRLRACNSTVNCDACDGRLIRISYPESLWHWRQQDRTARCVVTWLRARCVGFMRDQRDLWKGVGAVRAWQQFRNRHEAEAGMFEIRKAVCQVPTMRPTIAEYVCKQGIWNTFAGGPSSFVTLRVKLHPCSQSQKTG